MIPDSQAQAHARKATPPHQTAALRAASAKRATSDATRADTTNALLELAAILDDIAVELEWRPTEVRQLLHRILATASTQHRHAEQHRRKLLELLTSSPDVLSPVTQATLDQARRLANDRNRLLASGAVSASAIAEARGTTPSSARVWISRKRNDDALFTVGHLGETYVPAFLLDPTFEPRGGAKPAITALRKSGLDGWALWQWFDAPSPFCDGCRPKDLIERSAERLASIARRSAEAARG